MLALYLEGWDFKILFAENGKDAIEQVDRYMPDLITLDMKMPEMDGYQVIEFLRKDERLKNIPVIAITASVFKEDEAVLTMLCKSYLRKPVSRADLVKELMNFLPHTVTDAFKESQQEVIEPSKFIFPPHEKLTRIINASNDGNMTELEKFIAESRDMGSKYQPFVDWFDCDINHLSVRLNLGVINSNLTG